MRARIKSPDGKVVVIDATDAEVERLAGQPGYVVHILAPETLDTFPPVRLAPKDKDGWRLVTIETGPRKNWLYGSLTNPRAKA